MDVIVLAGTSKPSDLTRSEGVENKAFITINNAAMITYVINALQKVSEIDKIVIVGPKKYLKTIFINSNNLHIVDEGNSLLDNIKLGLQAIDTSKHCLIVTADLIYLNVSSVLNFIDACQPLSKDIYYPIINRSHTELKFPGVQRTYFKLAEGEFTGGNIFMVDPAQMNLILPQINRIFDMRKSPLKLASILGFNFIIKFISRKLTIEEVENRIVSLFSVSAKVVIVKDAELGCDVDKVEDLDLARDILNQSDNNFMGDIL